MSAAFVPMPRPESPSCAPQRACDQIVCAGSQAQTPAYRTWHASPRALSRIRVPRLTIGSRGATCLTSARSNVSRPARLCAGMRGLGVGPVHCFASRGGGRLKLMRMSRS